MPTPHCPVSRETRPADADLGFEAFRYVAGEMTDDESAAFEGRLALEQEAREAVARAVEISQAVVVLGPQAVPAPQAKPARPSRRSAVIVLASVVAACVALAVALNPFGRSRTEPPDERAVVQSERPANAARLVAFWADADDLLESAPEQPNGAGAGLWNDDPVTGENGADSEFAWMLAAVSAEVPTGDPVPPASQPEEN